MPQTRSTSSSRLASLLDYGADALGQAPAYFAGLPFFDPEVVRPLLAGLYREDHHGGRPMLEPVVKLQVLMTMEALGHHRINWWVSELKKHPLLRGVCGIPAELAPPGVATLYDFIHRLRASDRLQLLIPTPKEQAPTLLEAGTSTSLPSEPANVPESPRPTEPRPRKNIQQKREERQQRRASFLRTLSLEGEDSREGSGAARAHTDAQLLALNLGSPPRPSSRMNAILNRAGVAPSLERGLIPPHALGAIDGTLIASHASGDGRMPVGGPPRPRGEDGGLAPSNSVPRMYSDPTARWGRSASDKSWTFGFRGQLLVARYDHHELPLWYETRTANVPDVVMGIDLVCDFVRFYRDEKKGHPDDKEHDLRLAKLAADKGYDAIPVYELLRELDIQPRIPLANPEEVATVASPGDLDAAGYPHCPGGLRMRLHAWDCRYEQTTFNCPCKRPTHVDGKYAFKAHLDECPLHELCEPDTVMGPLVHTRDHPDLRLTGSPPRDSDGWKLDYNQRTSVERVNSRLQRILRRASRREAVVSVLGFLVCLVAHVQAWGAQELGDRRRGVDVEAHLRALASPPS